MDKYAFELAATLIGSFFGMLFLQSGWDKIVDRKGNLAWMVPHFEKSPFRGMVPILLSGLTVLELAAGLANTGSAIGVWFGLPSDAPFFALCLAGATLVALFAGQRLAKDYAGAASLAAYFAALLAGLLLLAPQFR